MKIIVCLALLAVATATPLRFRRTAIHEAEHKGDDSLGASTFHHEIEHEHAKSHQSVKFEHFHPVPVYVKKEHSHLLKHPLEKGKTEHGHKLLHPKTEHHHGYGLVLEEHRSDHHEDHHGHEALHGFSDHSDDISNIEHIPEHHEFAGFSGEHAFEGSEQVAAYDHKGLQEEGHYQYEPVDLSHLAAQENEEHGY